MKKDEFNSMIRLYFVSIPDDLGDDLCLVKGALIIVQKLNSEWAYGYHIKNQGGGTVGEYHLIFKSSEYDKENECVEWKWGKVTYLIEDEKIYKVNKLGINICPGCNIYFKV